jgi:N-acetyl-gamma-glutamyl-phosphate reductase
VKSVAIVGASGYTGQELQKLLARHPHLEAKLLMSSRDPSDATVSKAKSQLGQNHAGQVLIEPLNPERFGEVDGVFLCTPHGKAIRSCSKTPTAMLTPRPSCSTARSTA